MAVNFGRCRAAKFAAEAIISSEKPLVPKVRLGTRATAVDCQAAGLTFGESRVLARRGMPRRVHRHDRLAVVRRRTLRRVACGVDQDDRRADAVLHLLHSQPGAYVAKSQHRRDDFRPFLYKTTDFGATWTQIVDGLPQRAINVVFEDNKNPNFLAVGTDNGVHVSLTGGEHWAALKANMPVVPTHDLVIHPRDGDLVAGTYGRGVWITNADPLRELTEEVMNKDVHFFSVTPQAKPAEGALGNYRLLGDRHLTTLNRPGGLSFDYYLKERPEDRVRVTLTNAAGATVRTLDGTNQIGINRVSRRRPAAARFPPCESSSSRRPRPFTTSAKRSSTARRRRPRSRSQTVTTSARRYPIDFSGSGSATC
jgi:hypothetical protein